MCGIVVGQTAIPWWRRAGVAMILLPLSWYTVVRDLGSEIPASGRPCFRDGLCMQTTPASCSPCSAVGMLMEYGIRANEREMVRLCRTRYDGTPELGLYRGLKLKTAETEWDGRILRTDLENLYHFPDLPAVLLVDATEYQTPGGLWRQLSRADHAVVLFGWTDEGKADIGDPSSGRCLWSREVLQQRWHGTGLYFERRQPELPQDGSSAVPQ
jgi:hypothetical protein